MYYLQLIIDDFKLLMRYFNSIRYIIIFQKLETIFIVRKTDTHAYSNHGR
jgi:hypothetical protein